MAKKKKGLEALKQDLESGAFQNTYAENLSKKVNTNNTKTNVTQNNTKVTTNTMLNSKPNADGFIDTGKKLGQYSKVDYNNRKNWKVYSKDNKFYFYNEKSKKYEMITNNTNNEMKSADSIKKSENKQNEKDKLNNIANGTPFSGKTTQTDIASGKIQDKQKGTTNSILPKANKDVQTKQQLSVENQLKLDTSGLTGDKYNEYAGQLKANQDKEYQTK